MIQPRVVRQWAGAVTDSGFSVAADVEFCFGKATTRLQVAEASDTEFSSPAFNGDFKAVVQHGSHWPVKHEASGLSPSTSYRWRIVVTYRGREYFGSSGTLTTAPVAGIPASFSFVLASCSDFNDTTGFNAATAMLSEAPDFYIHLGDLTYDDNVDSNDPYFLARMGRDSLELKRNTRYYTRSYRKWPAVQALHNAVPVFTQPDDHDFVFNDYEWSSEIPGSSYEEAGANARQAWLETTPHPPLLDPEGRVMSYQFDWAATRFIVMDTRSQKRGEHGTILGAANAPFNQRDAIFAAIDQAGMDGVKMLFLACPCTWASSANDGFGADSGGFTRPFLGERAAIADALKSAQDTYGIRVVVLVGDMHRCSVDDGTNSDYSTGGMPRMVEITGSPLLSTSLNSGTCAWGGADSKHNTSDQMLCCVDVDGDNEQIGVRIYNVASGSAVLVAQYSTADLPAWVAN